MFSNLKMEENIIVKTETSYEKKTSLANENRLETLIKENWAVEIFWFPHNGFKLEDDYIWVRTFNKENNKVNVVPKGFYENEEWYDKMSQMALKMASPHITTYGWIVPYMQWASFKFIKHILYPEGHIYQDIAHAVHFRYYCLFYFLNVLNLVSAYLEKNVTQNTFNLL